MLKQLLVRFLFFLSFFQITAQNFYQKATPDWVAPITPDYSATANGQESSGFYYLLLDDQYHAGEEAYYERYAYKITAKAGIQEMSDISIEFDPEYQRVIVHKLNVIRNGKIINKLIIDDFKIIQREEDLERHLYNGRVTAINHLYDIREGDIIDYAYTTIGRNPIHKGNFGTTFYLQHTVPIAQIHLAIFKPKDYFLDYKTKNGAPQPKINQIKDHTRYSWSATNTEAILYESNTPIWYFPAATVELSTFKSWAAVAKHYNSFYKISSQERSNIKREANHLIKDAQTRSDSLTALIRFVQDDIRYLGFENGLNSFKPSKPIEVLKRRFGDCKDKALLLSTLLQSYGIAANPILVNSTYGKNIDEKLPSPFAFDHCIVQYKTEQGKYAYIDPTISDQGGDLQTIYYPNYYYGLVLDESTTTLTKLEKAKKPKTSLIETFSLDQIGGGAVLDIETVYYGGDADDMRPYLSTNSTASIQKDYTEFYSKLYPNIKVNKEVEIFDDRKNNMIKVVENYKIDSLWQPLLDNEQIISTSFYPSTLENMLYPVTTSNRTMPYLVNETANFEHKTKVYFPESWNIKNESFNIHNPGFSYSYDIKYKNAALEIIHNYEGKKDYLEPNEVSKYLEDHKKIQNQINYQLTYDRSALDLSKVANAGYTLTISIIIFGILLSAIVCWFLFSTYDVPCNVKERWHQPIGGWVAFFGIGIVLTPIILLSTLIFNQDLHLTSSEWELLFSNNLGYGILGVLEVLYNSIYFVFSLFVAILFFKKRSIAPRMIIIMNTVAIIFFAIDSLLILEFNEELATAPAKQQAFLEIGVNAIRGLIVILYFSLSERVKHTFVKTLHQQENKQEFVNVSEPEISSS